MAQKSKAEELRILWISEGMSCDGDSVAMTAAMQPSIEDLVLGLIPGIPKVHVHNKVLDPATGDDLAAGTCATYGGVHAMAGNPTGCMGLADYPGWDFRTPAGIPIVNVPGCPIQPHNFMEMRSA